ncbi:MAG: inositol-3-phosphate synthase [Deltaproteobacteria bacterium]|nr:inositol-3-phosphate synthase [Deltaproteobacteria bacterium]
MNKTGILFIGSSGYISAAAMAGAFALRKGLTARTGMVTDLPQFSGLGLIEPEDFVFGGWDIRSATPLESAEKFFRNGHLPGYEILPNIAEELRGVTPNLYEGVSTNCGAAIEGLSGNRPETSTLREQVERLRSNIRDFKERSALDEAVVFNLASTEPQIADSEWLSTPHKLEECVNENRVTAVRASTLYAYAAVLEGCPYINFTPSNGALVPAIIKLAEETGVPVMGNDGKTGETLVKSALIPMFLLRNLEVLSWEGFNILGNMDGQVLDSPENKESKIITKDRILGKVLGYSPHSRVHIHYVPSLDDQKTAWNFIHFKGFFGAKMSMQFVWQGYDSILAAPLVLDLARLAEFSKRRREAGVMTHLASFFKAPAGVNEHRLYEQYQMLLDYLNNARSGMVEG